jgi:purine-binding chemotaxis protein CheW
MTAIEKTAAFATAPSSRTQGLRQQFVTFALSGQQYCVDIMSVREIRMLQSITYLPGAPDYVCGVINLRGSIVPVCDLRLRLGQGHTEITVSHAVVIVAIDGRANGLLVDEVLDIVTVDVDDISPVPGIQSQRANSFFKGLINHDSNMLIVVDLQQILSATDTSSAPETAAAGGLR